jgi:hypothetical protein
VDDLHVFAQHPAGRELRDLILVARRRVNRERQAEPARRLEFVGRDRGVHRVVRRRDAAPRDAEREQTLGGIRFPVGVEDRQIGEIHRLGRRLPL